MPFKARKLLIILGCKLNFSETSTFGKMLEDMGVVTAQKGEQADICLINTCSVTEVADHKCRQAIHRMVRRNPGAFVIVTGCYAQLESENVSKIEGVDLMVLGANEKAHLIQYLSDAWAQKYSEALHLHHSVKTKEIKTFQPSCSRGNRTRYFLEAYRMVAIIIVPIVQYLLPVAIPAIQVLPLL